MYEPELTTAAWLPLMPEWYLVILALGVLVAMHTLWPPLAYAAIPLAVAILAPLAYIVKTAIHEFNGMSWPYRLLTMCLHMAQPIARLRGRINHGLTPWRSRGMQNWANPLPQAVHLWSEQWRSSEDWLHAVERGLSAQSAVVTRGGDFDPWDLEIRGGLLSGLHTHLAVEEHGGGKQLLRLRIRPNFSATGVGIPCMFATLAVTAALDHGPVAAALLGVFAIISGAWLLQGCARAKATVERALQTMGASRI
jgi:hypothetical protein